MCFVCCESRSFHCHPPPACLITSVPKAFLIHTGKKIESPVQEELKRGGKNVNFSVDSIRGRSVGDKASVIYHGEGNAQYRAMLIRAPSLKQ